MYPARVCIAFRHCYLTDMNQSLEELCEAAQNIHVSEEEHEKQRRSFAYGNTHIENKHIDRQGCRSDFCSPKNKIKCCTDAEVDEQESSNTRQRRLR